jgi:hypothetical protein
MQAANESRSTTLLPRQADDYQRTTQHYYSMCLFPVVPKSSIVLHSLVYSATFIGNAYRIVCSLVIAIIERASIVQIHKL